MLATVEAQSKPVAQEMEPYAQNWYEDICSYRSQEGSGRRYEDFDILFNRLIEQRRGEYLSLTKLLPTSTQQSVALMRLSIDFTHGIKETSDYFKELIFERQRLKVYLPSFYTPENIEQTMLFEANSQAHEAIRSRNIALRSKALCPEAYNELVSRISYMDGTITVKGINTTQPLNLNQEVNPGPTFAVKHDPRKGQMTVEDPKRHIIDNLLSNPLKITKNLAQINSFKLTDKVVDILLSPNHFHTEHSVLQIFIDSPFKKLPQMLDHEVEDLEDIAAIRFIQFLFAQSFRHATTLGMCLANIDKIDAAGLQTRAKSMMPFKDIFIKAKSSSSFRRVLAANAVEGIANAYILYGPSIQEWADTHNGRYPQEPNNNVNFEGYSRHSSNPWNISL